MAISGVLFDLEGVLVQAKTYELLPHAREVLEHCRKKGLPYSIITNNTVEPPESLLGILQERELPISDEQLLTPLKLLRQELAGVESALVIGSGRLRQFVQDEGTAVSAGSGADAVICGGSFSIDNELLSSAFTALYQRTSRFLCLHRNRVFKDKDGALKPDVGCLVAGLEYSTGRTARTLGKPSIEYFERAVERWGLEPRDVLLISDDPISDLGGGRKFGCRTAFVCTGKYAAGTVETLDQQPDAVWETLEDAFAVLS